MKKPFSYGGQAVIEGVMIRGRESVCVSVRRPDGTLESMRRPLPRFYKARARGIPFLRGVVVLIETLVLGVQSLLYSAQVAAADEEEQIPTPALWAVVALSLAFAIVLFFVAPLFLARALDPYIASDFTSNLLEGLLRIGFFLAYLKAMNLLPDIRRVFAYHGAEHKTINAYEAGRPLDIPQIRDYSTAHLRCGTSFIFAVLVIAILVFALLGRPPLWLTVVSRIVLLPVIASLGYEITRLGAAHPQSALAKGLLSPGLLLQSMTTREPDDKQLETAVAALQHALEADGEARPS
ncbi:MAG: DUF1385 domain-containing protein [bacterium]